MSPWRPLCFVGTVFGDIVLLNLGVVVVVPCDNPPIILLRGGLIGTALVADVLFTLVSMWVRTTKDLFQTRARHVRESECADTAAYLYDSMLQTLTLIRVSAENLVRVRAIALIKGHGLRAWLYMDHVQAVDFLNAAVTEAIVGVESRHGVPINVVVVGDMHSGPGELAFVAVLVKTCRNTVRHGAPFISAYVEVCLQAMEAFIKDSGGGSDPASIIADRYGMHDSIVGRMHRTRGNATIRHLARGTEVTLSVPRLDTLEEIMPNGRTQ